MKGSINWKLVAGSAGYKYFKKQYISSLKKNYRRKDELYRHFQHILGVAMNHAHHNGMEDPTISLIATLNQFSNECDYWYLNFSPMKKFNKPMSKPGIRAEIKYIKAQRLLDDQSKRERVVSTIKMYHQITASQKSKSRWKNNPNKKYQWEREQRLKRSL